MYTSGINDAASPCTKYGTIIFSLVSTRIHSSEAQVPLCLRFYRIDFMEMQGALLCPRKVRCWSWGTLDGMQPQDIPQPRMVRLGLECAHYMDHLRPAKISPTMYLRCTIKAIHQWNCLSLHCLRFQRGSTYSSHSYYPWVLCPCHVLWPIDTCSSRVPHTKAVNKRVVDEWITLPHGFHRHLSWWNLTLSAFGACREVRRVPTLIATAKRRIAPTMSFHLHLYYIVFQEHPIISLSSLSSLFQTYSAVLCFH